MAATTATSAPLLQIQDWGVLVYEQACVRQQDMVQGLLSGCGTNTLVLTEHPATVTLGRRGGESDLRCAEETFADRGVMLQRINRGGLATAHEPGQLVVYPVVELPVRDLRHFTSGVLQVVVDLLAQYAVVGELRPGNPGVWVKGRKICSFGIALKRWVSCHGIALNLNNDLSTFDLIVPCGVPDEQVTSLVRETGKPVDMQQIKEQVVTLFCRQFGYQPVYGE
ncbi:lipoyl(octanoyl) transferase LipB [Pelovirga terrestris]|uniref:Octanoyltransferase n=1 Tax=Pelovirga terrestris TaxID=2771352 RepID=A0A8J6UQR6_9BACT|nr:lipoyl(octanoyl) transferase LipB [Pelovirga terrestris]MBD1399526.1 lipoyl(octanoyl) transferase LipB [Pelovirga terrestris]